MKDLPSHTAGKKKFLRVGTNVYMSYRVQDHCSLSVSALYF